MSFSGQSVRQSAKHSVCRTVMDVRIGSIEIAQRFLEPMRFGFEHKPLVLRAGATCPVDRQAQLEGHVESWRCRRITIELDSRQIVKRIFASSNQLDDSFEASLRTGNLDSGARSQAECTETCDERQVKILVASIVWDIEKCGFLLSAFAHRATSPAELLASCSRVRFPFARRAMRRSLAGFQYAVAGDLIRERRQSAHAGFRDTIDCRKIFRARKWRLDYDSLHNSTLLYLNWRSRSEPFSRALRTTPTPAARSRKNQIDRPP